MAVPHFSLTSGTRQKGHSAAERYLYLIRQGKYEARDDLEYVEHGNYPAWAKSNPHQFWKAADDFERANGRVYTQLECALPRELSSGQRLQLIKHFVEKEIGARHPYTYAVHNPTALDGKENPHVHILFTERRSDGIERTPSQYFSRANKKHPEKGGAPKDRDWNRRDKVAELRKSWEQEVNHALEQAGSLVRIDMRSLKERGVDRIPEPKLGPAATRQLEHGIYTEAARVVKACRAVRKDEMLLEAVKRELAASNAQLEEHSRALSVPHSTLPASKLYEYTNKQKQALYDELTEAKRMRNQLGTRWSPDGYKAPPRLSKREAYEGALRSLGGVPFQEAEEKLQVATAEQYHEALLDYRAQREKLESPANSALLQSIVRHSLKEDTHRHQLIFQNEQHIESLKGQIVEAYQFQQELGLLGNEPVAVKQEVEYPCSRQALADPEAYRQMLERARTKRGKAHTREGLT